MEGLGMRKHFIAYLTMGLLSLTAAVAFPLAMETFQDTLAGFGAAIFAVIAVDTLKGAKKYYKPSATGDTYHKAASLVGTLTLSSGIWGMILTSSIGGAFIASAISMAIGVMSFSYIIFTPKKE
jgi:hypothetical protein